MANVSNVFAAILSVFISIVMLVVLNPAFDFIIRSFDDLVMRGIAMGAYLMLVGLLLFYFPTHILTAEDRPE